MIYVIIRFWGIDAILCVFCCNKRPERTLFCTIVLKYTTGQNRSMSVFWLILPFTLPNNEKENVVYPFNDRLYYWLLGL